LLLIPTYLKVEFLDHNIQWY